VWNVAAMNFDYHVLLNNWPLLIDGMWMTLFIVVVATAGGAAIGLVACIGSLRRRGIVYGVTRAYVDFFRTTPEMALIFWVYFCLPPLLDLRLSAVAGGTLALTLVAGAFLGEIFRAGVQAVPRGQIEAADALGVPALHRWGRIILPQAMRRMMPAFINYLTELLKLTTLLSAIAVYELSYQAYSLGAQTFRYVEFLSAIAVIYFLIIFPISSLARFAERRIARRTGN
jgi:His/Glu/Gln/Arg/opine family amino acid ABC transporter permease subunit